MLQQLPHFSHRPKHTQNNHIHELSYCDDCDLVYCDVCKREWKNIEAIFTKVAL